MSFKPGERSLDWFFTDPDTQFTLRSSSRADLIKQIITYRFNNNLEPIEHLDTVLDDFLCRQSCNAGKCRPITTLKRGLAAYWKGAVLLFKSLRYKTFVSQEEAEKRASQCKDCKFNTFPNKGHFIKWSDALAEATVGSRKVSCQKHLGNCSVCSCPLKAKVHYAGTVSLSDEELKSMQEVDCWQLRLPKEK